MFHITHILSILLFSTVGFFSQKIFNPSVGFNIRHVGPSSKSPKEKKEKKNVD